MFGVVCEVKKCKQCDRDFKSVFDFCSDSCRDDFVRECRSSRELIKKGNFVNK